MRERAKAVLVVTIWDGQAVNVIQLITSGQFLDRLALGGSRVLLGGSGVILIVL